MFDDYTAVDVSLNEGSCGVCNFVLIVIIKAGVFKLNTFDLSSSVVTVNRSSETLVAVLDVIVFNLIITVLYALHVLMTFKKLLCMRCCHGSVDV